MLASAPPAASSWQPLSRRQVSGRICNLSIAALVDEMNERSFPFNSKKSSIGLSAPSGNIDARFRRETRSNQPQCGTEIAIGGEQHRHIVGAVNRHCDQVNCEPDIDFLLPTNASGGLVVCERALEHISIGSLPGECLSTRRAEAAWISVARRGAPVDSHCAQSQWFGVWPAFVVSDANQLAQRARMELAICTCSAPIASMKQIERVAIRILIIDKQDRALGHRAASDRLRRPECGRRNRRSGTAVELHVKCGKRVIVQQRASRSGEVDILVKVVDPLVRNGWNLDLPPGVAPVGKEPKRWPAHHMQRRLHCQSSVLS